MPEREKDLRKTIQAVSFVDGAFEMKPSYQNAGKVEVILRSKTHCLFGKVPLVNELVRALYEVDLNI